MVTEGVFTPAHMLAEAIRRREVSSVEVVDAYLAQIARYNPDLNAVVTLDEDGARMRAREADAALASGEEFFADRDVLIVPAGIRTAERHGEEPTELSEEYPYALSTLSGCPMVVIPAGVDNQGLPFGLQIIGKRWDDERLLGIAESVSGLTGGFRQPPGY
jgi:Asp-tRNA(Asn)/Glu-tRNA(Gln) amidotransferase A subunit family amidase